MSSVPVGPVVAPRMEMYMPAGFSGFAGMTLLQE
jgi:hypothetical protein